MRDLQRQNTTLASHHGGIDSFGGVVGMGIGAPEPTEEITAMMMAVLQTVTVLLVGVIARFARMVALGYKHSVLASYVGYRFDQ
ncbi:MAG: hypothetical protein M3R06_11545 [Chloroflexota bacterium]|nr:hypothetical protein [Chloroflexota bacterium]